MFWHSRQLPDLAANEGAVHATDATNASRTSLYNIHDNCWDETLLSLFNVPAIGLQR